MCIVYCDQEDFKNVKEILLKNKKVVDELYRGLVEYYSDNSKVLSMLYCIVRMEYEQNRNTHVIVFKNKKEPLYSKEQLIIMEKLFAAHNCAVEGIKIFFCR